MSHIVYWVKKNPAKQALALSLKPTETYPALTKINIKHCWLQKIYFFDAGIINCIFQIIINKLKFVLKQQIPWRSSQPWQSPHLSHQSCKMTAQEDHHTSHPEHPASMVVFSYHRQYTGDQTR